jgi:hypothetical protein
MYFYTIRIDYICQPRRKKHLNLFYPKSKSIDILKLLQINLHELFMLNLI